MVEVGEAMAAGVKIGEGGAEPGLVVKSGARRGGIESAVELEDGVGVEAKAVVPGGAAGLGAAVVTEVVEAALGAESEVEGELEKEVVEVRLVFREVRGMGEVVEAGLRMGSAVAPPFHGGGGKGRVWEREEKE